ncbi:hypothetical protein LP085_01640 [Achromobacter sp. MY14]|uniref:hypothetical protein n=1 Tax=unclassified Achromobacter TaxID=2626865 RepID=UPI001E553E64|nr:hypothetical protein [Achromobacter sp. MY14]MCD0495543.1 hypothetical protein [Achromobacter sp. MY14]
MLEMLSEADTLRLPLREREGSVQGLSGKYHKAWATAPSHTASIARFDFRDSARATLTLDDGRTLDVLLVGSVEATSLATVYECLTPTIAIIVEDPAIASMSPEDLRRRLTIDIERAIWCAHWDDRHLAQLAEQAAVAKASDVLDWGAADRESLLHVVAKRILEEERQIRLPDLVATAHSVLPNGDRLVSSARLPGTIVELGDVQLEMPIGQTRPDVVAQMYGPPPWNTGTLLIEITVTNAIAEERLERIRRNNLPALEIDVRQFGGEVTRSEYAQLIVDEVAGKRWLHHPELSSLHEVATASLARQAGTRNRALEDERQLTELATRENEGFGAVPRSGGTKTARVNGSKAVSKAAPLSPAEGWRSGPVSTANSAQWRTCGCVQWAAVLQFGEDCRDRNITVALALKQCSERFGHSIELLKGVWRSAGLM